MWRENNSAFRITIIYTFIATLWILLSDTFVAAFSKDVAVLSDIQTYKGIFYVVVTSLLIYYLIRSLLREKEKRDLALKEREEQYRILIDTIPNGLQEIDTEGTILYANRRYHDILGYEDRSLIGTNVRSRIHPASSAEGFGEFLHYLVAEEPPPTRWYGQTVAKDGRVVDVQTDWNYKRDAEGRIVGFISIISDISDQKEQEAQIIALQNEQIANFEHTIHSLVDMIESRDTYTGGHSERVAKYSRMIAESMGYDARSCDLLYRAGILHDIGKVSTPDAILLKPGALNALEFKLIQEHVTVGTQMLRHIPMYREIADIIAHHHEHFDGTGYPKGLARDAIPELSRIMIVADAFDAMTTDRVYKGRKSLAAALQEIRVLAGSQFDPRVVKSALTVLTRIELPATPSLLPMSEIEQERFAYYFKDHLTGSFNSDYLDIVLHQNVLEQHYRYIGVIYLNNFTQYNRKYSWNAGDQVLYDFAQLLQTRFPGARIFRIYGDDFAILGTTAPEIDTTSLNGAPMFRDTVLSVQHFIIDLETHPIGSFAELERHFMPEPEQT